VQLVGVAKLCFEKSIMTKVFIANIIVFMTNTIVFMTNTIMFETNTIISTTMPSFPEMETIVFVSDTTFSFTEKTVDKAERLSTQAHISGCDPNGLLNMDFGRNLSNSREWKDHLERIISGLHKPLALEAPSGCQLYARTLL
jgi:hypothetical protein